MTKARKVIENLSYGVLALLIIAQCIVNTNVLIAQWIYLAANGISVFRSFILKRPAGDKVKDCACTAITIGLIVLLVF